jgi:hypothetical protein
MIDISIKITIIMSLLAFNAFKDEVRINDQTEKFFKSRSVNGMIFQWAFDKDNLHCKATAPTTGWVAIGFNTKDELSGTNLIMGAVEQDFVTIDDRFIIRPGNHKSITELGGSEALTQRTGSEFGNHTTISFSIPLSVNDKFHHELREGEEYYVLMAFSQEDDFQHHSMTRTTVKIKL